MAFDPMPSGGSGGVPDRPHCTSCGAPISEGQRSVRVDFNNDPKGYRGLSGLYHEQCSKPFAAFARVVNLNWFGRF